MKNEILDFYSEFECNERYLSYNDIKEIKEKYKALYNKISKNIIFKLKNIRFIHDYKNIYKLKDIQNKKYTLEEINNTKHLLDNINGHSLDYNQRCAVITSEDNSLVIAGAGSGKTLTIIGKIRYLIEKCNIKEDEILCISFTNDSVNDIKKALSKNYNYNIPVYTFHKLALTILKDSADYEITIASEFLLDYIIDEYFKCNFPNNIILDKSNINIYIRLKSLISTFINLFKSNNYNISEFNKFYMQNNKLKDKKLKYENNIYLNIIKDIYILYKEELESQNMIDFNDMINLATKEVNNNIKYKYIIIDEYQDTSLTRYQFIKKIRDVCNAKIMAVGDDFQSIYRFTGCNLDIFLNFEKYFGKSKILKIENTYRNSKELIDVAGTFIMKNKYQMKKNLKSDRELKKPIKIVYYKNLLVTFEKLINMIDTNIFVLGRNNKDINFILKSNKFKIEDNKINYINSKNDIRYLTVHRSKGLEADNTIILNMLDDYLGFPSKIVNDRMLNFVTNDKDLYPYEEERRLFYVALTRTKNNVYILTKRGKESIFVKEIINNSRKNIQIINELI